jgi:putative transposase
MIVSDAGPIIIFARIARLSLLRDVTGVLLTPTLSTARLSSRKAVCRARLMRAAGLYGASRRKWVTTPVRDRAARPAPDLVERNFSAPAPNRLWITDISYISTRAGFLYLAVVLDAFSRKIVGWAMETYLRTELVLKGAQHGARATAPGRGDSSLRQPIYFARFRQTLRRGRRAPLYGLAGDCRDNAMCESFFATLECELLDRKSFKTQGEARMAVFDLIEGWYNPHRRHSALDYSSPIDYERSHSA